jgi:hypothetical protein
MAWSEVKREMLRDPRVAKEYRALGQDYQLARFILADRLADGRSRR